MDPDAEEAQFIAEDDLSVNKDGNPCLILRVKNCTGNMIDLETSNVTVSEMELARALVTLSVDQHFKYQRSRTISQAVDMVIRQRTIASGFFDFNLQRLVKPMTLDQAAKNVDNRHRMITGENQHIEKKTLDDYYGYIRAGTDPKMPFDFKVNKEKNLS